MFHLVDDLSNKGKIKCISANVLHGLLLLYIIDNEKINALKTLLPLLHNKQVTRTTIPPRINEIDDCLNENKEDRIEDNSEALLNACSKVSAGAFYAIGAVYKPRWGSISYRHVRKRNVGGAGHESTCLLLKGDVIFTK